MEGGPAILAQASRGLRAQSTRVAGCFSLPRIERLPGMGVSHAVPGATRRQPSRAGHPTEDSAAESGAGMSKALVPSLGL